MSEQQLKHENGEFERRDLSASGVVGFLGGLLIVGVLVVFLLASVYAFLDRYQKAHEPPQNPLVGATNADTRHPTPQDENRFPLPRLETNEGDELNDLRLQEEKTLNSYGWLDQKAGVAHIPIERAMELVVERGLPTVPQHAAAPVVKHQTGVQGNSVRNATRPAGQTAAKQQ